jgi:hypothetical protein
MIPLRRAAGFCLVAMALTACEIRSWLDIDLSSLENGSVEVTFGLDEDFRNAAELSESGTEILPNSGQLEGEGWKVETFVDGDIEGVVVTHEFSGVDELNSLLARSTDLTGEGGAVERVSVIDTGDTIRFESSVPDASAGMGDGEFTSALNAITFDARISITFPGEVIKHNGELEGRTVTWSYYDEDFGAVEMFAEARKGGGVNWAVIAGGLMAVGLLGLVVWRVAPLRKSASAPSTLPETAEVPAATPPE